MRRRRIDPTPEMWDASRVNGVPMSTLRPTMKSQPAISFADYIEPFLIAYHERTGRTDGAAIIRDTLATYGVTRLRDISDGPTEAECVGKIVYQLEHNT